MSKKIFTIIRSKTLYILTYGVAYAFNMHQYVVGIDKCDICEEVVC